MADDHDEIEFLFKQLSRIMGDGNQVVLSKDDLRKLHLGYLQMKTERDTERYRRHLERLTVAELQEKLDAAQREIGDLHMQVLVLKGI